MMSEIEKEVDFDARQDALNITNSYAVQAPAGSGKTELLSLRFLRLLSVCQQPEEVLAITFTKKAANEMAERILSTLEWASNIDVSKLENQLDQDRFAAARNVLLQDEKNAWLLQQSPSRLRIQTIDSFSNFLAGRLPILSNFGGPLQVSEQVEDCYSMAVQNCLKLLDEDTAVSSSIAELLLHFDNDTQKIESLLLELLKQREQWIAAIAGVANSPEQALAYLTRNLTELVEESLNTAAFHLQPFQQRLIPLLHYATDNLARDGVRMQESTAATLLLCADLDELPDTDHVKLPVWLALSQLLLTKDKRNPAFRKQVDKNSGFPAPGGNKEEKQLCSDMKQAMKTLLTALSESNETLAALDYLRRLPLPDENTLCWEFLATLTAILPTLVAQLELAFSRKNKVDYPQVSLAALRALGAEDKPTDLALSLDYQIKHILVDEFQDTSSTQMDLLLKLTAGWEPDDGRTLFVVGDAMQSCYSFRNANVGLFIKLREAGLRDINIEPVDLLANFRSDAGVVKWVNRIFSSAFPERNDISRGAVTYSRSQAVHPEDIATPVATRCYQYGENSKTEAYLEEAAYIADEITRLREKHPEPKIAILVRSRPHLEFILPALREAGVPWLANAIDKLSSLPVITDIMSLTSALCNQADRLSWLALLRAPWCGLALEDLHLVANWNREISVLESLIQLTNESCQSTLSDDGLLRLRNVTPKLNNAVAARHRYPLSRVIQALFIDLGGEHIVQSESELDSLDRFYELLSGAEIAGSIENFAEFQRKVENSFVSSPPGSSDMNPIHVMTIHKSKGLEFDHVFLPGLARSSRADDKPLLLWHQRLNQFGDTKLFLATLAATGSGDNSLYNLLRFEKAEKLKFESTRLLYIGVTRAMKSVYLSAALPDKDGDVGSPGSRTLLHTIWDGLLYEDKLYEDKLYEDDTESGLSYVPVNTAAATTLYKQDPLLTAPALSRLPGKLFSEILTESEVPDSVVAEIDDTATDLLPELSLLLSPDNQLQIQIGNLLHETLHSYLGNSAILNPENIIRLQHRWRRRLLAFNFTENEIQSTLDTIESALQATISNEETAWIFDSKLQQSAAGLSMQSYSGGSVQTHVLDRTFIDEQGQRWIIDYKSSSKPDSQSLSGFLEEQMQLHGARLSRYRSLFSGEANNGIRTALLFTRLPKLVETH